MRLYYDEHMLCTYDCDALSNLMTNQPLYIDNDTTLYSQILFRPIIVRNNAVLKFTGEFQCAENVYIQSEIGTTILLRGATFFSICSNEWEGFKIKSNLDPNLFLLGVGRSMLDASNSTIQNAKCGILGDAGSILRCDNTEFINNYCDVALEPHTHTNFYRSVSINNTSEFNNCYFYTDKFRHEDTCTSNISLRYTKDVSFKNCNFFDEGVENKTFYHENRNAVYAYRSGINLDNNEFYNSGYAIKAINCLYFPIDITNNYITRSHYGIYMSSTHGQVVTGNKIKMPALQVDTTAPVLPYGIYLDYCHDYQIEADTIYVPSTTMYIYYSDVANGIVVNDCFSNDEEIYRNRIYGIATGIQAVGLNKDVATPIYGLKLSCNELSRNVNDIFITNNLTNPYPAGSIGVAFNQGSNSDPSGNLFTIESDFEVSLSHEEEQDSTHHNEPDWKTAPNFINYLNDADYLNYYHHDTIGFPKVYPDSVYNMNRIETSNVITAESCPDRTIDTTGGGTGIIIIKLTALSDDINEIDNTLSGLVDGGNTSLTVAEIILANDNSAWQTYLDLMDKSPYLSSESLKEVAKKEDGLSAPMVRDVLVANPQAAKDPQVKILLDERIDELPDYMIEQIAAGMTEISPKEYLEAQKASLLNEYSKENSKLMRHYMRNKDTYSNSDIESLLNIYSDSRSSVKLAEYYASVGNYLQAVSVINSVQAKDQLEQENLDNLTELFNLFNSMNLDSLNIENINDLLNIEANGGIAGSYARDILVYNNIITYNEPVYLPNLMLNRKTDGIKIDNEGKYFNAYPNPAGDYIYIDYKLPDESKNIMIKIILTNVKNCSW